MKASWMILLALAYLAPTLAQSQTYRFIRFRNNDPFVFCTEGWSREQADMGWIPMPPYATAAIILLRPQKYWSSTDWEAYGLYLQVCPAAETAGGWTGSTPANMTPSQH